MKKLVILAILAISLTGCAQLNRGPWTPENLAKDIDAHAAYRSTGVSLEATDVTCMDTPATRPDGLGWYLCSWRSQGTLAYNTYAVEVSGSSLDDIQWSTFPVVPGKIPTNLTEQDRKAYAALLLASPAANVN